MILGEDSYFHGLKKNHTAYKFDVILAQKYGKKKGKIYKIT